MKPTISAFSALRLTERPEWLALQRHANGLRTQQLRSLFEADSLRGDRLRADAAGLYLDYSKQRVTDD